MQLNDDTSRRVAAVHRTRDSGECRLFTLFSRPSMNRLESDGPSSWSVQSRRSTDWKRPRFVLDLS
jgi:hypothetical protein